jgi:hypothetical protein
MRSLKPDVMMEDLSIQRIASAGIAWEVFLDYDPVFPDAPEPQGEARALGCRSEGRRATALVEEQT